jgi:plastocyanin
LESKYLGKLIAGLVLTGVLVVGLLASCSGGNSTVTVTAAGSGAGSTKTVTVTSGGSGGGAATGSLVVYGDMVTNVGCLNISIGHRGELVVFRDRVVDPKTGTDMTDKELKSVQAVLPDGQKFDMVYGGHPGGGTPTDYFWSAPWEIPLTYPTGSLGYTINAVANDGRTGKYQPFAVASSTLTIANYDANFVRPWTVNVSATGFAVTGFTAPITITVTQGAKITFSNKDTIPHKVTGDGWDSGDIAAGKTYVRTFSTPGSFIVKDAANATFTITIVVNAAPAS